MAENDTEYVPSEDETLTAETTKADIESEKNRIVLALASREFSAKFPLPDDLMSHKSEAFKVFQVIYNTENIPIQNWFMCSVCHEVIYVVRSNGTAKLRHHKCFPKWKNQQQSEKSGVSLVIGEKDLASLFARVANIGFPKRKFESKHIRPILPKISTPDEW